MGAVRRWAAEDGDRVAVRWLPGLDEPGTATTFAELDDDAGAIAAAIRAGTREADRVLLVEPPGPRFVAAFLGCLYARRTPVPVYPVLDSREGRATITRIADDCRPTLAWVGQAEAAETTARLLNIPAAWQPMVTQRHLPDDEPDPAATAFLQYTSGSTSSPKGVVVTHGNLRANVASIAEAFGHTRDEVILSWLPAYHDMGLIGNILHPLHLGSGTILCAPTSFIRRPLDWLTAVDRLGVTTTGAPNFAYDLVVAAVERFGAPDVDLSGWRIAYSGAEPVVPQTMRRFGELLAPRGFDQRAFVPCYGLAESTLLVSCAEPGKGSRSRATADGGSVTSCGPARGCSIAITDGADRELGPGQVGEIRVNGPSVTAGYWGRPGDETFAGPVSGREGTWLRTGDLGFVEDGELHVSGRLKDVINVRGRNHHPHDIERLATQLVPAFRPGQVIAFPSSDGEGVVIVGERRAGTVLDPADTARLTGAVAENFGLAVRDVVVVPRRGIPRTTSGKPRRATARERYEAGGYVTSRRPRGTSVEDVAALVEESLGRRPADGETLTDAGLDSLGAVWLSGALADRAGIDVSVRELLSGMSLDQLTDRQAVRRTEQEAPDDPHQLSVAQESLVFLNRLHPNEDAYTISVAWQTDASCHDEMFRRALGSALSAQPQLALRVRAVGTSLRTEPVPDEVLREALTPVVVSIAEERLDRSLEDAAATVFRLDEGPLVRVCVWQTPARRVYQLVVHHVLTDLWSLGLLFQDVAARYEALVRGTEAPPAAADRYPSYVAEQHRYLHSRQALQRDAQLRALFPPGLPPLGIRTDRPRTPRRDPRAGQVTLALPEEVGIALAGRDRVALLTALWGVCLHRYGSPGPVTVGAPVAGRPTGRHAAVAGLCTNTVPITVPVDPDQPLDTLVAAVREQLLAGVGDGLYPLARAVEKLRPSRAPGRMPLVETLVTVQESPLHHLPNLMAALADGDWVDLGPLRLRPVAVRRRTCRYDLDLVITPRDTGGHLLTLDYAAQLFERATAEGILRTYAAMVAAAVGTDADTVTDVFVLSERDRALYDLAGRSSSGASVRPAAALHAVAAERPAAEAVVDADGAVTFEEFAARAGRLAATLVGVAAEAEKGKS
ncbi:MULTISPECIES: AMP-binding protein [unclassified Streptomyces]|uniref:AMP-binding protein n=1 Tax=unclassified Streptomyces TaxID=2593676 RepID=UPI0036E558EF